MSIRCDKLIKEVILEKLSGKGKKASFTDSSEINTAMLDSLDKMNKTSVNRSYREIPARGAKGKVTKLMKRVMRRLTFWYVEPCMIQQTEYNCANNVFSAQVNSEINTLRSRVKSINAHDAAIKSLSGDVTISKAEIAKMNARLDSLEERNAQLEQNEFQAQKQLSMCKETIIKISGGEDMLSASERDSLALSFSQCGEDAIIRYIFSVLGINPAEISYLDLGANHAVQLSNTYSFYLSGARGVLLDANPELAAELREKRPGDTVINRCLSDKPGTKLDFYIMSGDGLSTMDYEAAQSFIRENPALSIEKTVSVDSITINEIIEQHFPDKAPELMNIDIEGMELEVLKMTDFEKFRPAVVICEMIEYKSTLTVGEKNQEILEYMKSVGYEEFAFTGINSVFIDSRRRRAEV